MRAIDTNVVVRMILRDDLPQAVAADEFVRMGAWISTLVLAEAVWKLGREHELKPAELATAIEMLLNHRSVVLQDAETVKDALNLFRARPGLGFSDCLIIALARKAGHVPLGTFDRRLANAEGAQKI